VPTPDIRSTTANAADLQTVDIATMTDRLPRSVGVEHVTLHAISQLGLVDKLSRMLLRQMLLNRCIGGVLIALGFSLALASVAGR